ncbi:hypothetical protein Fmac_000432 [Flemingia macrophylla]|uniref:Zinc knuckle CX2CX4HX4C domain-containing protein n=1 Tax=Flemingia macrophylla TaxID=520843 RepID=A0ABD1NE89_9FABA
MNMMQLLSLDQMTTTRDLGYFARVLVDIDLKNTLPDQILVERKGFAFFVNITYERLPEFCSHCHIVGHSIARCNRASSANNIDRPLIQVEEALPRPKEPPKSEPFLGKLGKERSYSEVDASDSDTGHLQVHINMEAHLEESDEDKAKELPASTSVKGKEVMQKADSEIFFKSSKDMELVEKFWTNMDSSEEKVANANGISTDDTTTITKSRQKLHPNREVVLKDNEEEPRREHHGKSYWKGRRCCNMRNPPEILRWSRQIWQSLKTFGIVKENRREKRKLIILLRLRKCIETSLRASGHSQELPQWK